MSMTLAAWQPIISTDAGFPLRCSASSVVAVHAPHPSLPTNHWTDDWSDGGPFRHHSRPRHTRKRPLLSCPSTHHIHLGVYSAHCSSNPVRRRGELENCGLPM